VTEPALSPKRRIWLVADDYGLAPGISAAIRDLIARDRLNATSAMVVAPAFDRTAAETLARLNAEHPRAAVGLHLTLTAPFRPLSARFQAFRAEAFLPVGATLRAALLRRFEADALAAEIEAQFAAFMSAFGRPPDFVDGHHHVHLFPQVRDAALAAAKRLAPDAWIRQCGQARLSFDRLADPKGLLIDVLSRDLRRRARALRMRVNPAFAGTYSLGPDADFASLFTRFVDGLPDGGVVMCHPGFVDAELKRLDWVTEAREREYAYFVSDAFTQALAQAGVALAVPTRDHVSAMARP
jgi:chitin disaccharide deacetylase